MSKNKKVENKVQSKLDKLYNKNVALAARMYLRTRLTSRHHPATLTKEAAKYYKVTVKALESELKAQEKDV